jgi:hypothetical protein
MDGLSSDILKPTARPALMPSFQEDVEKHSAEEVVVDDGGQCLPSLSASRFGPIPTRAISLGPPPTARPALMPSFQEDVEKHLAEEVVVDDGGQCLPSLSASRFGPIPTRAISLGPRPTARPALMPSIQEAVEEHLDSCAAGQPSRYGPVPTQSLSRAVSLADDHPDAVQSSQWAVENNELFMSTMPTYTVFQLIFTYAHGSSQKNYLNAPDPGCKQ